VRLFLGLLHYSPQMDTGDTDAIIIDDFQQALEVCSSLSHLYEHWSLVSQHLESTHNTEGLPKDMILPIQFCIASESRIRLGNQSDTLSSDDPSIWEALEIRWAASRGKGEGILQRACAEVGRQYLFSVPCSLGNLLIGATEPFWLDLIVQNPIEAIVVLRDFTLRFSQPVKTDTGDGASQGVLAVSEILEEVHLLPKERRIVRFLTLTWHSPKKLSDPVSRFPSGLPHRFPGLCVSPKLATPSYQSFPSRRLF